MPYTDNCMLRRAENFLEFLFATKKVFPYSVPIFDISEDEKRNRNHLHRKPQRYLNRQGKNITKGRERKHSKEYYG